MRPRLHVYCDGVPLLWIEDPRTDDTDTITLALACDGRERYFPWPTDDKGQPVNPWMATSLDFSRHDVRPTGPKPPAERPETWRTKPGLL
jgi:hypothetical protein